MQSAIDASDALKIHTIPCPLDLKSINVVFLAGGPVEINLFVIASSLEFGNRSWQNDRCTVHPNWCRPDNVSVRLFDLGEIIILNSFRSTMRKAQRVGTRSRSDHCSIDATSWLP